MGKIIECGHLPERENWFVAAEEDDFLVVAKGSGIPSAPLGGGSVSVFEKVAALFPDVRSVRGKKEGEGGLLHRIDTETCGLLLIARNDAFFSHIEECREAGTFVKEYTAYSVCGGGGELFLKSCPHEITSRFRPFGKKGAAVKPVFDDERSSATDRKKAGPRVYATHVAAANIVSEKDGMSLVRIVCRINEGFRHQVRAHLSYSGFPVLGDSLYNERFPSCNGGMLFFASAISFTGTGGENVTMRIRQEVLDNQAIRNFKVLSITL